MKVIKKYPTHYSRTLESKIIFWLRVSLHLCALIFFVYLLLQ